MKFRGFQTGIYPPEQQIKNLIDLYNLGIKCVRWQITAPEFWLYESPNYYGNWSIERYREWWNDELIRLLNTLPFIPCDMQVIVDCHTPVGGVRKTRTGYQHKIIIDNDIRHEWNNLWLDAVDELDKHPNVRGYDLCNEPFSTFQAKWLDRAYKCSKLIRRLSRKVITVSCIRGEPRYFKTMKPIDVKKVWYQAHFYQPSEICFYGINQSDEQAALDAVSELTKRRIRKQLKHVRDFQIRYRKPIYIGEFGCSNFVPDIDMHTKFFRNTIKVFNRWGWHWSVHAWREYFGFDTEGTEGFSFIKGGV